MAEALIRGVLGAKLVTPDQIITTDIVAARTEYLSRELGVRRAANAREGLELGRLVVIAVKPQDVPALLVEIAPLLRDEHTVVSIAAGVTIATLEGSLTEPSGTGGRPGLSGAPSLRAVVPVVRVMPNTPALV